MKPSFERYSYSRRSIIHFSFSSSVLLFSFILKEGTVGKFLFKGPSFIMCFSAIFPNNLPRKDCLYFFLPWAISSHCEQCFSICETVILPQCAGLFSVSD